MRLQLLIQQHVNMGITPRIVDGIFHVTTLT
jgi:hypothetical protein